MLGQENTQEKETHDLRGSDLSKSLRRTPWGAGRFHYDEKMNNLSMEVALVYLL